jgi:hypothetical protein
MKVVRNILLVLSFLLLFNSFSNAAILDAHEYWVPYNTAQAFEWIAVDGAAGYEIYIWQLERSKRFLSGKIVTTNKHSIVWKTHGHYVVYVRHFKLVNGVRVFGEWGNSLDPAVGIVDGKPRAWVIYVLQP